MKVSLRPYQDDGIAGVLALFARLVMRVLVVLPTGGGKTVVAAELVLRVLALYGGRALFLAHRQELVKQAWCKLVRAGVPVHDIGVIMAGISFGPARAGEPDLTLKDEELWKGWARRRPPARVQVGSIDTYRNKTPVADVRIVVFDEAHRALATSYVNIAALHAGAYFLGLTATPIRGDGKGLRGAYDEMVVLSSYADLIASGHLVRPLVLGWNEPDLSGVKKSRGDYDKGQLAQAVNKRELVGDIVTHWLERGNRQPTFCFGVDVKHSKSLCERFLEAGVPAVHVDGNTPDDERERAFADLRARRVLVFCNVDVATEGTDVPVVKTIVLARPTMSMRVYLQQAGRGSRPCDDCDACRAKQPCTTPFVILDHGGCSTEIELGGPPHWNRFWSLDGAEKRGSKKGAKAPQKKCLGCYCVQSIANRVCEDCGLEFPIEEEETPPKEKDGTLVEINELSVPALKRLREWNELVRDWRWQNFQRQARGERVYLPGWLNREWTNRTGSKWPPKGCKIPKLTEDEKAHNADVEAEDRRYQRQKDRRARDTERLVGGM